MTKYQKVQFSGPIAPYVDGLRVEFSTLSYAPSTVNSHLALWAQLSRWFERRGLEAAELTVARIEEFLAERRQTHHYLYTIKALSPGLEFLRRVGAVPGVRAVEEESPVEVIEGQLRRYLLIERGLAEVSAETYVVRARPLLAERVRRGHWIWSR